jgi:hypothetical protein
MKKVAAVLGAGIQGCCAALALTQLGFQVRLYDKSKRLFNRASANQEGKIHLGFVYARDPSMVTARIMIEHAMQFAPALESLIGTSIDWEPHLSRRFFCGIHQNSSLTSQEHENHFNALQAIYEEVASDTRLHYLGQRPKKIWKEYPVPFAGDQLIGGVLSEERAVHPLWMRNLIVKAVEENQAIEIRTAHEIKSVERTSGGLTLFGTNAEGEWKSAADVVVNCLWEGKHRIDQSIGFGNGADWITRIKYGFILDGIPEVQEMLSLIVTHGPFGDFVNYPWDRSIYVTWYPACLAYIGQTDVLPGEWEAACDGSHPVGLAGMILKQSISELSAYVPQLSQLKLRQVMAGTIMGTGKTDISDLNSGLHKRHGIGVDADEGYYSIFTGKYTSGPANAIALRALLEV